jgi:hypothetical protein
MDEPLTVNSPVARQGHEPVQPRCRAVVVRIFAFSIFAAAPLTRDESRTCSLLLHSLPQTSYSIQIFQCTLDCQRDHNPSCE